MNNQTREFPLCFNDKEQYEDWVRFSKIACVGKEVQYLHSICKDCTKRYQAEMIQSGRCANPSEVISI